ncbi:hypothetical protein [Hungatella hathewayi]|nr:hypothetical protein [Hungatella hathewayi]
MKRKNTITVFCGNHDDSVHEHDGTGRTVDTGHDRLEVAGG